MSKKVPVIFFLFIYFLFFSKTQAAVNLLDFPFKIFFSDKEIQFLRKQDDTVILKLVRFANLIYKTPTSTVGTTTSSNKNQINTNSLSSLLNPTQKPNSQNPNRPPDHTGASGLNDGDPSSNPNFNPNNAPQNGPTVSPLTRDTATDFSQLPPAPAGSCPNFGVSGNMGNIISKIKFDTNCLCIAFGGQLKVVSGHRPGDPRNHGQGLAIDIAENNFRDRTKDSMLVIALIALQYNIGSYHPGFGSFHADRENSGKWKTWSGVAGTDYGGIHSRNYYQMIQDALNLIGTPAVSSAQFRGTYGSPAQTQMAGKARDYIQANGNEALKKCLAAN